MVASCRRWVAACPADRVAAAAYAPFAVSCDCELVAVMRLVWMSRGKKGHKRRHESRCDSSSMVFGWLILE